MPTVPKTTRYLNKKIRDLANGQPCQHCGRNDGTTVAAHMNGLGGGRGMGLKAHDYLVAYLCGKCHWDYDGKVHKVSVDGLLVSQEDFIQAMIKTMGIWIPRLLP